MAVITVSRTHGSGGTAFAGEVALRLGYETMGSSHLKDAGRVAKDRFCSLCMDEPDTPSFLERFEALMSNRNFYKTMLSACVYDFALTGNAVFIGMGAQVLLGGIPNTLHIRVVRNLGDRVKAVAAIKNISHDDAYKLIEKMDYGKSEFISHYFDKNVADPTLYHLTVNSTLIPIEYGVDCAERYVAEYTTPDQEIRARDIIAARLLEKRAELILFNLDMAHDYGKVIFEAGYKGILLVKGVIGGAHAKEKLFTALRSLPDVTDIEDHVKVGILSHIIY